MFSVVIILRTGLSRAGVFSVVITLRTGLSRAQFLAECPKCQDQIWCPAQHHIQGVPRVLSPSVKPRVMKLTIHLHPVPWLRMTGVVPLHPLYALTAGQGLHLYTYTYLYQLLISGTLPIGRILYTVATVQISPLLSARHFDSAWCHKPAVCSPFSFPFFK